MSELYTSLTQLKMAMNGGRIPPMTPLTDSALRYIDPAFSIGMGALMEDAERGLRCPVRGCGAWHHMLQFHMNTAHRSVGGARAIRAALQIPSTAALASQRYREARAAIAVRNGLGRRGSSGGTHGRAKSVATNRANRRTMGARNLRGVCETQLAHRFIDLHNRLGHSPTMAEFGAEHGSVIVSRVLKLYGTWNNALTHFGFERNIRGPRKGSLVRVRLDTTTLLDGLAAWYKEHGSLPTLTTVERGGNLPLLHAAQTYYRAFGVASWPRCMEMAASALGITTGRYGLDAPAHVSTHAPEVSHV